MADRPPLGPTTRAGQPCRVRSRVLPDSSHRAAARALANLLDAARPAVAPAALDHEAALAALSIASRDGQEGIASFAERRAPVFHEESS